MIVSIRGKLIQKMPAEIIIEVGGIGYALSISTNTFDQLPKPGDKVSLFTYFHVTENNQSLFAFSNETERELFLMLIGVAGIGPKTAIVLLSSVTPDEFKRRLIAGEVSTLTALPGIGPKTARRIIVELKDKFVDSVDSVDLGFQLDSKEQGVIDDVVKVLLSLGYNRSLIDKAVSEIATKDILKDDLEKIIKMTLKKL